MLQGHLENIQEDGLITGWCWDPDHPTTRAKLTVLVDNQPIGDLVADNFRPDLEAAGVGDGAHAFAFLLPWSAIASKSVTSVHVADSVNNRPVGGSLTFRRTALVPVEQRIAELEHSARLLQARLAESNRHTSRVTALVQSTLATIGAFFTQLAEMPLEALSQPGSTEVRRLLTAARTEFEPFSFAVPTAPLMTICISGEGSLADFYGCLRALKACGLDNEAEIVVVDADAGHETGLIPLLVQNIRYWSLDAKRSLLEARNRVADLGARDLLVFLSPAVRMRAGWLEAVRATLAAHPRCAVLGSTVLRLDGTIQSSALTSDQAGRLTDFSYAEMPDAPWHNRLAPVAAVPDHAILIRQPAFREVEGFDPAYVDLAAAAADLCLRCWDAGYSVLYQPGAALSWHDEAGASTSSTGTRDTGLDILLAERWQKASRPAWPASKGRALIIDTSAAAAGDTLLQSVQALQELGYDVAFGEVTSLSVTDPGNEILRAMGVEVLITPYYPSVVAAIKAAAPAFDIIQISPAAASYLSLETIRSLSPSSRTIVTVDKPAQRLLATPGQQDAAALLNAVMAADAVMAPTDLIRQGLPKDKQKAVAVLVSGAAVAREGLWLLLDGPEEAVQDAGRWLATLLPALSKALPDCVIHTVKRVGLRLPAGIKQHTTSAAAGGELLGRMRLALAPFRLPALDTASIMACAEAGLPLIVTPAALGSASLSAGMVEVAANAQAIARLLRKLESETAWDELAAPLQPVATTGHWVAAYRSLAKSVRLAAP
jgi:O-antigen biosynthesis protein